MKALHSALAVFLTAICLLSIQKAMAADEPTFGALMPIETRGASISNSAELILSADWLGIQAADLPAMARFRIPEHSPAGPWIIVIKNPTQRISITSEDAKDLGRSDSAFQLTIVDLSNLVVSFSPGSPNLIYDALIKISHGERPQYIISQQLHLYYALKDLIGQAERMAISRAVVKLEFDVPKGHTQCTGFQIFTGQYLTNRHCVDPALRKDRSSVTKVTFGIDDQHPNGQGSVAADLVKMGSYLDGQREG